MPDLLVALRNHLVTAAVVRKPPVPGVLPPMWLKPQHGVPGPGEPPPGGNETSVEIGPAAVLGAFRSGGIAPQPQEASLRTTTVDIWIRTNDDNPGLSDQIDDQLRAALIDRKDFWLGGTVHVAESQMWHELQPLEANEQGYTDVVAYVFSTYSGLP